MIEYRSLQLTDIEEVVTLWNESVTFYKPFTISTFTKHVIDNPEFSLNGAFICLIDGKVIGFSSGHIRDIEKQNIDAPGYLTTVLVDKKYRRQGIGTQLVKLVENYLYRNNKTKISLSYKSTLNYPWFIPGTNNHDHAGAPGAAVNSDLYLLLVACGYEIVDHQDAFHRELKYYQMPEKVAEKYAKNINDGYQIEIFDEKKHYGLDAFYQAINDEGFERVIRNNLLKENPDPFYVIVNNNRIVGWTGAFYTEPSGRAHFDGIVISPEIRGRGLGQALFCHLGIYSKEHGSQFMTFFTGRTNFARYIYLGAGFKIIQTFAIMMKGEKK